MEYYFDTTVSLTGDKSHIAQMILQACAKSARNIELLRLKHAQTAHADLLDAAQEVLLCIESMDSDTKREYKEAQADVSNIRIETNKYAAEMPE
jgi:hypothetical protein